MKIAKIINPQQAIALANKGHDIVFRIDGELYKVTKDTPMQYFITYETFLESMMQAHINYEAHLRLKNEVEEYLAKGGKIEQVKTIHLNGVENASEHQVKEINDWVDKHPSYMHLLQKRISKKIKNQPKNFLKNVLTGRKKLPIPLYEIILEEMY